MIKNKTIVIVLGILVLTGGIAYFFDRKKRKSENSSSPVEVFEKSK